jgi:condensin complex subunit 2
MDDGEGAMGDADADADAGEQDLLASTEGRSRRVRPEFVNYAKRAKRVDVRKLKDNIWKGLKIVIPRSDDQEMVSEHVHFSRRS